MERIANYIRVIKMSEYANRRKKLMRQIGASGVVILPAAPSAKRNADYDYPYRQNSDFYYLTGFEEPEAVAILCPERKDGEFILFNRPHDREIEIWEGYRAGQEGAKLQFGADLAFPISELSKRLPELLEGREEVYYAIGVDKSFDRIVLDALNQLRGKIRSGYQSPVAIIDSTESIHEMRLIKSPAEINLMRKAAEISVDAHLRAMQHCKPSWYEYQLEAELTYVFKQNGARFYAYEPIVGSGANSCILHYSSNNQVIQDGSIVLIDAGCEFQNYASDITRTFPANGRFTDEQRAIYEIVLSAQLAAIKLIRPGLEWVQLQQTIIKILTEGLVDLGLLKGRVEELIEKKEYLKFYMHNSGHWLGLDVHDVGRYKIQGKWRRLEPGMVLTVEPGLYVSSDIPGVHKRWQNIGVRIEDDVLVTSDGYEILSKALPKTIGEIESIMR